CLCLSRHNLAHYVILCSFNDSATTAIYTLSLHRRSSDLGYRIAVEAQETLHGGLDRLGPRRTSYPEARWGASCPRQGISHPAVRDRKSTRLNSSHEWISYAVFCLKKKKRTEQLAQRLNIR